MKSEPREASVPFFPPLDELRGAPRAVLLHCLQIVGDLGRQGIRPPDGYLFELSKEIMRAQEKTLPQP